MAEINKYLHISRSLFSFNDFELRMRIQSKYAYKEWEPIKDRFLQVGGRYKISKSAFSISERIANEFGVNLFPLIIPIANKGFNISGGTAAFCMYDKDIDEYLFDSKANEYHKKKKKIHIYDFNNSTWVSIN